MKGTFENLISSQLETFYQRLKSKKENFELFCIKVDENVKKTKFEKVILFHLFQNSNFSLYTVPLYDLEDLILQFAEKTYFLIRSMVKDFPISENKSESISFGIHGSSVEISNDIFNRKLNFKLVVIDPKIQSETYFQTVSTHQLIFLYPNNESSLKLQLHLNSGKPALLLLDNENTVRRKLLNL